MDIEVEHIERQIVRAVFSNHLLGHGIRIITVPALLIAERPHRRHRHVPGKVGVARQYLLNGRPLEEVVIHLAALRGERGVFLGRSAEIEVSPVAVIEENAVGRAVLPAGVERNALVNRIGAFLVREGVRVPHGELAAALVEPRRLFAQPVEVLVEAEPLGRGNQSRLRIESHRLLIRIDESGAF